MARRDSVHQEKPKLADCCERDAEHEKYRSVLQESQVFLLLALTLRGLRSGVPRRSGSEFGGREACSRCLPQSQTLDFEEKDVIEIMKVGKAKLYGILISRKKSSIVRVVRNRTSYQQYGL